MIDLTPILQALIGLLATWVTLRVIPWLKAKTTREQQTMLQMAARIAVHAAEQVYGTGHGEAKLTYAAQYLKEKGFQVDIDLLESEVQALSTGTKK